MPGMKVQPTEVTPTPSSVLDARAGALWHENALLQPQF